MMRREVWMVRRFLYISTAFALLGIVGVAGATKLEDDLRARLATSEAARSAAIKDKAALAAALERITKSKLASQSAAQSASKDAAMAQDSATNLALITQQAAIAASTAALVAQQQAHAFNSNSLAMIGVQILVLFGLLAGFANGAMRENRRHKWVMEESALTSAMATKTQETMLALEKNTNSIKDALVKTTGEKAFAEGLKQGEEKSK